MALGDDSGVEEVDPMHKMDITVVSYHAALRGRLFGFQNLQSINGGLVMSCGALLKKLLKVVTKTGHR